MSSVTRYLPTAARLSLGLIFGVFGLNGFLGFLPQPPLDEPAVRFFGALVETGYMLPLIKGTEVAAAALLLSNRWVPLALTILAPITVNIVAFHTFLSPGLGLPLAIVGLQLYLAFHHRAVFRPLLAAMAPGVGESLRRRVARKDRSQAQMA